MRIPRVLVSVLLGLLLAVIGVGAPTRPAAAAEPSAAFTTRPAGFTPNGDGFEDVLETGLVLSAPAHVHIDVYHLTGAPPSLVKVRELLDETVDDATTIPVIWDGTDARGQLVEGWRYGRYSQLVATVDWAAGGSTSVRLDTQVINPDDPNLVQSPQPGAKLPGWMTLAVSTTAVSVQFELSGCPGGWSINQLDNGALPPIEVGVSGCAPGEQTLTATPMYGSIWGLVRGAEVTFPVEVAGDGPQLALVPDLTLGHKTQTLLRYDDGYPEYFSIPLQCRDADPTTFDMRIQDASGTVVRTWHNLYAPATDNCRTGKKDLGVGWDGTDANKVPVPDGTYDVTATVRDAEGREAGDRSQVIVVTRTVPIRLIQPTVPVELGASMDLAWQAADGVRIEQGQVSLSGCLDGGYGSPQYPRQWSFFGQSASGGYDQVVRLKDIDLATCRTGDQQLTWKATWLDPEGEQHTYGSAIAVSVRGLVDPEVRQSAGSLSGLQIVRPSPGALSAVSWDVTCAGGSDWTLDEIVIGDTDNRLVTTLPQHGPTCSEQPQSVSWDGRNAHGDEVADGTYRAQVKVVDGHGHVKYDLSSFQIDVDKRAPYAASVADGDQLSAADVVSWAPQDGVHSDDALLVVEIDGAQARTQRLSPDAQGRFVVPGLGAGCAGRVARLELRASWSDRFGGKHPWQQTTSVRCAAGTATPLAVVVTGSARTDQSLRARPSGVLAGDRLGYQWQRDGRAIGGATGARYTLTAADVGHAVRVQVHASAADRPIRTAASAAVRVEAAAITTTTPTALGVTHVGHRLALRMTAWRPEGVQLSYRWLRDGRPLSGTMASSYRLTRADRGHRIAVRVTGRKPGYLAAVRKSTPTPRIR